MRETGAQWEAQSDPMSHFQGLRDPSAGLVWCRRLGAALLLVHLASPSAINAAEVKAATDAEEPKRPGLKEIVKVNLVQLEVTVWPKKPESDACLGLTADDFELLVDGDPQPIYAVDALGSDQQVYNPGPAPAGEPSASGMSYVLFFDLWHLDLFYKGYIACPPTKQLAFSGARKFAREEFHDGDRLLLVTAAGWPVIHYGWIRTQADALKALDRLEMDRQVIMPRQEHSNHLGWIAGMESFFLALGRYPGRKDVIYLADDFRFDDVTFRMYDIAARAQSNGVVVSAVDLLDSCRRVWGPGPSIACAQAGGLGCSEFSYPVALAPLSLDTGGQLFRTDRIDVAMHELRSMRKCRYVVSFRSDARKRKRNPSVIVNLRDSRKDVTLLAPSSFQPPEKAPSRREQDEALFLLPRFGRGIAAQVTLWPYRPAAKRGRWKAFALARLERTDDEPWPDDLTAITITVLPHRQSKVFGEWRKTIAGEDLKAFRARGETRLLLFPLDAVQSGNVTVDVTVTSNVEEISAKLRKSFDVPEPPGPGEAHPWFLSDKLVRFGESEVLAPSFDDVLQAGQPFLFIGYGCRPKSEAPDSYEARLVPFSGGASVAVPVTWLDAPSHSKNGCGWLVGQVSAPLPPGLWTFEPPPGLRGKKGAAGVEFNVVSSIAPAALPADLTPR